MRLASTFTILSAAAVASASLLRNLNHNECLDVLGDVKEGAKLTMITCEYLSHGNWNVRVTGDKTAVIETNDGGEKLCISSDPNSRLMTLTKCSGLVEFERAPNTSRKYWSFLTKGEKGPRIIATPFDYSRPHNVLYFEDYDAVEDDRIRYLWDVVPQNTMYQKLYSWMRYQRI
ncbi:hypothetical protein EC968_004876 [Mortierella alpina]|nr:hypothetical protein EC968_004876 [Mortierella alpina]